VHRVTLLRKDSLLGVWLERIGDYGITYMVGILVQKTDTGEIL